MRRADVEALQNTVQRVQDQHKTKEQEYNKLKIFFEQSRECWDAKQEGYTEKMVETAEAKMNAATIAVAESSRDLVEQTEILMRAVSSKKDRVERMKDQWWTQ
jgi:hypothetical protein